LRNHGMILAPDGAKMSKSKGNTIEPDGLIDQGYGADAIRIMELFIGPWNQSANWSVEGMGGSFRFLQRVWALAQDYQNRGENTTDTATDNSEGQQGELPGQGQSRPAADDTELKRIVHRAIQRVGKDLEAMGFNTAIAALMETINQLYKVKTRIQFEQAPETWGWAVRTTLQLLAPFAPHITEEIWEQLGEKGSIHLSNWPAYDEQFLTSDTMTIVVQVNGKLRAQIEVAPDTDKDDVLATAQAEPKVAEYLSGKEIKKSIYVPGKIVNFVV
jgi:leucyl-tRNA synthetase